MMNIFEELNEDNFTLFAIRHYDNPQCTSTEEFYEDIRRFRYLKRLLKRYAKSGELRERLILNHLIVLSNLFGVDNVKFFFDFSGRFFVSCGRAPTDVTPSSVLVVFT